MEHITIHHSRDLRGLTHLFPENLLDDLRALTYFNQIETECFHMVAQCGQQLAGRLFCIRNDADPTLWYLGDLHVSPAYRRRGIARAMIQAAQTHLTGIGAARIRVYIEPGNAASLALHRALGFAEVPWQPFNALENEGQLMLEHPLLAPFSAQPAAPKDAMYIASLYFDNMASLHGEPIPLPQWQAIFANPDPDEAHFLVCRGILPVAWLKLNGLLGGEAWISMLVVGPAFHRQGAGRFALAFAEDYARQRGFTTLHLCTTQDNHAAQALYLRSGYTVTGQEVGTYSDGEQGVYWIFAKQL